MVADGRGFDTDRVEHGDVRPPRRGRAEQGVERGVGAGGEERTRQEVVAAGQDQRVGILIVERVDQRAQDRRGLGGQQAGFAIGEVQQLQASWPASVFSEVQADEHRIMVGDAHGDIGIEDRRIPAEIEIVVESVGLVGIDVPLGDAGDLAPTCSRW